MELHRVDGGLPAPCRDAMALPENAAAYNHRSGKRNKNLLLQRPLKAMLLAALIGHFKESISDSYTLHLLPQPWAPRACRSRRKHIKRSPALPLPQHVMRLGELRGTKNESAFQFVHRKNANPICWCLLALVATTPSPRWALVPKHSSTGDGCCAVTPTQPC